MARAVNKGTRVIFLAAIPIVVVAVVMLAIYPAISFTDGSVSIKVGHAIAQEPSEIIELRTQSSKTYDLGGGFYHLEASAQPLHYYDGDGWKDLDLSLEQSSRVNWDWEVTKAGYTVLIRDDTTLAVGKAGNWIGFQYAGIAYLDKTNNLHLIIQEPNTSVTPEVQGNVIRWENLFYDTTLEYVITPTGLKENLIIGEQARAWLEANPPSSFGMDNAGSYFGGYLRMDWQGSTIATYLENTIDWASGYDFTAGTIEWKDQGGALVTALPLGQAYAGDETVDLTYRFYRMAAEDWLLFGGRVQELNGLPEGPVVIDPTINEQATTDAFNYSGSNGFRSGDQYGYVGYSTSGLWQYCTGFNLFENLTMSGTVVTANVSAYYYGTSGSPQLKIHGVAPSVSFPGNQSEAEAIISGNLSATGDDWDGGWSSGWNVQDCTATIQYMVNNYTYDGDDDLIIVLYHDGGTGSSAYNGYRTTEYSGGSYALKLDVTYTTGGGEPSISGDPSHAFGVLLPSTTNWANGSEPSWPLTDGDAYLTLTNDGAVAIDIYVNCTDFAGGAGTTLVMGSPGMDEARISAFMEGDGSTDNVTFLTSDSLIYSNLAASADIDCEVKLELGTASDYNARSANITFTAEAS